MINTHFFYNSFIIQYFLSHEIGWWQNYDWYENFAFKLTINTGRYMVKKKNDWWDFLIQNIKIKSKSKLEIFWVKNAF